MLRIPFDEDAELLNGGDDDSGFRVAKLFGENSDRGISVGCAFLKAVVLADCLIVEVLSVDNKEDLVDVGKLCCQLGRLEGSERLAGSGRMPDIAATIDGTGLLVVVSDLYLLKDAFCSRNLVGAHHKQQLFRGEHAEAGKDVEQSVLAEKRRSKINQVSDDVAAGICPVRGELEAVAGLLALALSRGRELPDMRITRGIGIVLCMGSVGNNKDFHVLVQPGGCPETVALVAVDLIEGFTDGNAPALQFHMNQGKAVDKDGHIVACFVHPASLNVLIDNLKAVVVYILPVKERNVLCQAIVTPDGKNALLLDKRGLLFYAQLFTRKLGFEKRSPFSVGEGIVVQRLKLLAQVGNQLGFAVNGQVFVPLFCQLPDEGLFQVGLALVGVGTDLRRSKFCDDSGLGRFSDYVVSVTHETSL